LESVLISLLLYIMGCDISRRAHHLPKPPKIRGRDLQLKGLTSIVQVTPFSVVGPLFHWKLLSPMRTARAAVFICS